VFDKTNKELTFDLDHLKYISRNSLRSDNYSYSKAGTVLGEPYLLRGDLPSDITIFSGKVDYTMPLKKNARFEAGAKSSYVETDNDARYSYWLQQNLTWAPDRRSNHFVYEENINAVYVNGNKQIKKWGVQLGLRLENTNAKGKQLTNGQAFDRNYTQLFPTSFISYALNKQNNFGLSYGRRIERPNYQDMNPFQQFLDQYTYSEGNPYLTPQFTHNIELSHNYKGQLNTSINWTRTTDIISDVVIQNDTTRVSFRTKRNLANRRNVGISVSLNKPITKVWSLSAFTNVFNNFFEGRINNAPISADYTAFTFNMNNQFKFKKAWSAELSGFFRSKMLEGGINIAQPMGMVALGGSKQILKNKGTVRVNIRDPFLFQQFRGHINYDNVDLRIRGLSDSRQLSVNFTYRFGKNQNNIPQIKRRVASQEEQNRVGQ
jgi:hypothetical protein